MREAAKRIIKEAKRELIGGGYTPESMPVWHPYYWIGRLKAAQEVMKDDRVRRRNRKPRANRPAR